MIYIHLHVDISCKINVHKATIPTTTDIQYRLMKDWAVGSGQWKEQIDIAGKEKQNSSEWLAARLE